MEKKPELPKDTFLKGVLVWLILGVLLFLVIKTASDFAENRRILNYSDFLEDVEKGNIQGTLLLKRGYVYGNLKDGTKFQTYAGEDKELISTLI